ncbi:MAG: hypothetical protein ACKVTZ_14585 [Bacteroidia bacterium]
MIKKFIFSALTLSFTLSLAQKTATTVWHQLGVKAEPSKDSKEVGKIFFGENVTTTPERIEVSEDRKRTYVKLSLPDGKEGWINEYLLIPEGEGVVINTQTAAIRNPKDPKTFLVGMNFEAGEPVVKTEFSGKYAYIIGVEKNKKGWVPIENLYMGQEEVRAAVLLQKAKWEKNVVKRANTLTKLQNSPEITYLKMKPLIDAEAENAKALAENASPEEKAAAEPIVASSRGMGKKPNTNVSSNNNSNARLANAKFDWIVPRSLLSMKAKNLGKNVKKEVISVHQQNYWKYAEKLNLIEVTDAKEGSGFKCYHNYLPVGTRVMLSLPNEAGAIELQVVGTLATKNGLGLTAGTMARIFGKEPPSEINIQFYGKAE